MDKKLTFKYDSDADILVIHLRLPYAEQESEEIEEGVIASFKPETEEIESLEILFFMNRLQRGDRIQLPLEFSSIAISVK